MNVSEKMREFIEAALADAFQNLYDDPGADEPEEVRTYHRLLVELAGEAGLDWAAIVRAEATENEIERMANDYAILLPEAS